MKIADRVPMARQELANKSGAQMDLETAIVWGARAVAAYEKYKATGDIRWHAQTAVYMHEALEHAAGGPPGSVEKVHAELEALINARS